VIVGGTVGTRPFSFVLGCVVSVGNGWDRGAGSLAGESNSEGQEKNYDRGVVLLAQRRKEGGKEGVGQTGEFSGEPGKKNPLVVKLRGRV